jgi:SAM-dependent methyltransferase
VSGSERQRRDWDDLAHLDPYWAVLTDERRRFDGWEPAALLATGAEEVDRLLAFLEGLGLAGARRAALGYGCGVGRLTRALAGRFETAVGADISPAMLAEARRLNDDVANAEFVETADLASRADASFDLIYSNLVLQHSESARAVVAQVAALPRLLAPGGALVFQLPARVPLRKRVQVGRRLYGGLRRVGLSPELLYRRLRLHPMHLRGLPEEQAIEAVTSAGARVVRVERERWPDGVESATYFATRGP